MKPKRGESSSDQPISVAFVQSTPDVLERPCMSEFATPTPTIEPIRVCEDEAGRPKYQVPSFQIMAAISRAKTMAKPAPDPTCRINSTGSKLAMPRRRPRPMTGVAPDRNRIRTTDTGTSIRLGAVLVAKSWTSMRERREAFTTCPLDSTPSR